MVHGASTITGIITATIVMDCIAITGCIYGPVVLMRTTASLLQQCHMISRRMHSRWWFQPRFCWNRFGIRTEDYLFGLECIRKTWAMTPSRTTGSVTVRRPIRHLHPAPATPGSVRQRPKEGCSEQPPAPAETSEQRQGTYNTQTGPYTQDPALPTTKAGPRIQASRDASGGRSSRFL
jgi:hypothetical protein